MHIRRFFLTERLNMSKPLHEWVHSDGTSVKSPPSTSVAPPAPKPVQTNQATASKSNTNIVTIVYDPVKKKLRAQADDGVHGVGNVAFPNNLRNSAGQQYEVETLVWNGKNYRASGDIKPVNSASGTQNIFEKITKENNKMNFQTILEELDHLYEDAGAGVRLDTHTLLAIEDLADAIYRNSDEETVRKCVLAIKNTDVTVDDLRIAAENSDYPREIKSLIAHMKAKGFETIGDFKASFNESTKEAYVKYEWNKGKENNDTYEILKNAPIDTEVVTKHLFDGSKPNITRWVKIDNDGSHGGTWDVINSGGTRVASYESSYTLCTKYMSSSRSLWRIEYPESVNPLTEDEHPDDSDETVVDDEPIVDDETAVEDELEVEDTQFVLECANCGALVIKAEDDVEVDDETDLANVKEECQFCDEADGYKVIGTFMPSEGTEDAEVRESLTESAIPDELLDKMYVIARMDSTEFTSDGKGAYDKLGGYKPEVFAYQSTAEEEAEHRNYTVDAPKYKAITVKQAKEIFGSDIKLDTSKVSGTKESLEELFGFGKKKKTAKSSGTAGDSAKESQVTIEVYDENGTKQFSRTFTEISGKMSAEDQFNEVIKSNGVLQRYKSNSKKSDWSYVRKSNPPSPRDTDKYINPASRLIKEI